jgi:hypothetical protein
LIQSTHIILVYVYAKICISKRQTRISQYSHLKRANLLRNAHHVTRT